MKYSLLILFLCICIFLCGQSITNEALKGSWEVIQIDNKVFKGGVITYFEFTEDQELIARSINKKDQDEEKNEIPIGSYELQDELFILHRATNDLDSDICKVFLKEENGTQLLVVEEYGSKKENEKINQVLLGNVKKTSVLKRLSKQ